MRWGGITFVPDTTNILKALELRLFITLGKRGQDVVAYYCDDLLTESLMEAIATPIRQALNRTSEDDLMGTAFTMIFHVNRTYFFLIRKAPSTLIHTPALSPFRGDRFLMEILNAYP
jgi:hypothetical protein